MVDYHKLEDQVFTYMDRAHDPSKVPSRQSFFAAEYGFFRKRINDQRVLVAGSGLGHDSFELAKYNKDIIGVDILPSLLCEANKRKNEQGIHNVVFLNMDCTALPFSNDFFDAAVFSMCAIGNFTDLHPYVKELSRVAKVAYMDFYPPGLKNNGLRKQFYIEEGIPGIRHDAYNIYNDEGFASRNLSKEEFSAVIKEANRAVEYVDFHELATMAIIKKTIS